MQIIKSSDSGFQDIFKRLLERGRVDHSTIEPKVKVLIDEIKQGGENLLCEQVGRFDGWQPESIEDLRISTKSMHEAFEKTDEATKSALKLAYDRIYDYHAKNKPKSWMDFDAHGNLLGQKATPVDRAGLYIPGGKAAYPSSLLMNAIPAIVAGVEEIVICTPAPGNDLNPLLLAAMHFCGIKEAYKVGGASAVATMAYGTESIRPVDVITGPGNIFVATAKKMVYGDVNIDMIAGPSEIGVIADGNANPELIAIDMLSQAEHDEMASTILITDSARIAKESATCIEQELAHLSRKEIATQSIEGRCWIIEVENIDDAVRYMNEVAPEHLEVLTTEPMELLPKIKHAGAIFLGNHTPEAIGDYIAGPNHTLPTGGTARFYSPLGTEHFMKKSSIISFSQSGLNAVGESCVRIADIEGLEAHALSVRKRLK